MFKLEIPLCCRLQQVAEQLVENFVSAGLMVREWDRVKLHGTIMNTLFRKHPSGKETNVCSVFRYQVLDTSDFNFVCGGHIFVKQHVCSVEFTGMILS